eukprot:1778368-Rhodomonas_salina.2
MVVALAEQQGTRRRFREEFAKRMGGGIPSETGSLWDVQAFARGYEVSCGAENGVGGRAGGRSWRSSDPGTDPALCCYQKAARDRELTDERVGPEPVRPPASVRRRRWSRGAPEVIRRSLARRMGSRRSGSVRS